MGTYKGGHRPDDDDNGDNVDNGGIVMVILVIIEIIVMMMVVMMAMIKDTLHTQSRPTGAHGEHHPHGRCSSSRIVK